MSVRAYIVFEKTEREYVTKKFEECDKPIQCLKITRYETTYPLFNVWRHTEIFDLIRYNGYDATDNNCCGEIGIDADEFKTAIDELSKAEFERIIDADNGYGSKVINKLYMWFERNDYIVLNCY